MRPRVRLFLLGIVLGAGTARADAAPHPWGVEKFLTVHGMWEGCKKGSRVHYRTESSSVVSPQVTLKTVREKERRLVKIKDDVYVFEVGKREYDKEGKPGRWKRKRTEGYRTFKTTERKELGEAIYRLGETNLPVRRVRMKTVAGSEKRETEFLLHAEHGVVQATTRFKWGTITWRLLRLAVDCKVGMKTFRCREYERRSDVSGLESVRRVYLSPRVPGYKVRVEYRLLLTDFVEQLLTFAKPK